MTTFLLIRHAAHDLVGKALAGRQLGIMLNETGQREAAQLTLRLAGLPIHAFYTSPRERAQQTAAPLAQARGLPVQQEPQLDDINFGGWTGRTFSELSSDAQWPVWCQHRTAAQPPDGERIAEVQQRIIAALDRLAPLHPEETVAIFSHCDVIKSALAHYLAIPLDELERFEIAPASVSVLVLGEGWSKVLQVNGNGRCPGT